MSRWIDNNVADRLYMVNRVSEEKNIDAEPQNQLKRIGGFQFKQMVRV